MRMCVRRDLHNPRMYYAGLENGLYVSWDAGEHWFLLGLGLPDAAVYDLQLNGANNSLVVATHGRSVWILDDLTPFQEYKPESFALFAPEKALRFWPSSQVEGLGDGAFYGKNPPYGAELSYYLAQESKEPGALVIKDATGHVVRTMKGTHTLDPDEAPPEDEDLPPAAGAQPPSTTHASRSEQHEAKAPQAPASSQTQQQLTPEKQQGEEEASTEKPKEVPWVPAKAGLQRMAWDLRADGPVRWEGGKDFNKGPRSGALVPPGEYTVTMTVGGKSSSQKLVVMQDPTSHGDAAGMKERFQASESVLHELSQVDTALNRIDAINAQLVALGEATKGMPDEEKVKAEIDAFAKKLKTAQGVLTSNAGAGESTLRTPDQIHEKLFALDGLLEGDDTAPSVAVLEDKKLVDAEYRSAIGKFNQFLADDAKAFNSAMAARKLTGIVTGEALEP